MHWRRFAVSEIPLDDQKEFDLWLRERWTEKDQLLQQCFETGRFPTELAGTIDTDDASIQQKAAASAGYVEAYVRLSHWTEFGRVFTVLAVVTVLCRLAPSIYGFWSSMT